MSQFVSSQYSLSQVCDAFRQSPGLNFGFTANRLERSRPEACSEANVFSVHLQPARQRACVQLGAACAVVSTYKTFAELSLGPCMQPLTAAVCPSPPPPPPLPPRCVIVYAKSTRKTGECFLERPVHDVR